MYTKRSLEASNFQQLLDVLADEGYRIIGPVLRNGVICYDDIRFVTDLPRNVVDEQSPGRYRTQTRSDDAMFSYHVGPDSWKKILHPAQTKLWRATRTDHGFEVQTEEPALQKLAFLGVRPCDLHAIRIQDKILSNSLYQKRLSDALIIAVQCTTPAATCFCSSMNTGPFASTGFDLALTEICGPGRHVLVVDTGSEKGAQVLARVITSEVDDQLAVEAEGMVKSAADRMMRKVETEGIVEMLYRSYDHPEWQSVAQRCFSCGNCTVVCPTCFCTTFEDSTNLQGDVAERWEKWDSCFNADFTYMHGGSIRRSIKSRYRQWLTHKIATWTEQFGSMGCIGCGRCITWCPAGIDLTQVLAAIRNTKSKKILDEEEVDL